MYMMKFEGYKFQSAISKHKFLKCRLFMTLTHVVSFGLELRRANPSNEDAFRMLNSKSHKANWTRISSKHHMFTDNMCCLRGIQAFGFWTKFPDGIKQNPASQF
jgi:hypothetical protein